MDGISIRYQGDKKVFKLLDRLVDSGERKQLLESFGAYGVSSTQQRFLEEQGPDGARWVKSRRAQATGGHTLSKTRRLFTSFVYQATASTVAWGTNVIYAGIHQLGGVIKAKNGEYLTFRGLNGGYTRVKQVTIPARPYLGISDLDTRRIEQIAGQWVGGMTQ